MKVIAFEEHYKLPAISEEHQKEAITPVMGLMKQAGYGGPGPQGE